MDESTLQQAAEMYGSHPEKIRNMRVAIVAGEDFDKAVAFERIIARYGAAAIVFNFPDTARLWLDLDAEDVDRSLRQLRISEPRIP